MISSSRQPKIQNVTGFYLLSHLVCSQIWLKPVTDDGWMVVPSAYITKLKRKVHKCFVMHKRKFVRLGYERKRKQTNSFYITYCTWSYFRTRANDHYWDPPHKRKGILRIIYIRTPETKRRSNRACHDTPTKCQNRELSS